MLDWIWQAIIYNVPWWVWLWLGLLAIAVILYMVRQVGGLKNALMIAGAAAVALAAGLVHVRARQQGARDQQVKEQKNANTTLDNAHDARADVRSGDDDPSRLRDDDGFRRDN